jgi:putative transposase
MNPIVVAVGRSASHNFSNNRWAIFLGPDDDARYRDWLAEAAGSSGYAIHACVLMTNHVHLLLTPLAADSLPRNMQSLGRAPCATSTRPIDEPAPWEGRYRAAPIDEEAYFLACCRYIELNPVRARTVPSALSLQSSPRKRGPRTTGSSNSATTSPHLAHSLDAVIGASVHGSPPSRGRR